MRPILLVLVGALILLADAAAPVAYPSGYRTWAHVKSGLIGPTSSAFAGSGGLHHIYTNEKGLEGYRTGKFPDGSVIVYELLTVVEKDGETTEGDRRRLDVMTKDSRQFAETGGWGFERFRGGKETDRLTVAQEGKLKCFECHGSRKTTDSTFSEFRK